MYFEKKVDMRNREAVIAYLTGHFRYDTMRSWNASSSYANCIKVHHLDLTGEQLDRAFEMLDTEFWHEIDDPIADFTDEHHGRYTIGTNGRSGGYLVLYQSERRLSEHKSVCTVCGQRNFKRVHELAPQDTAPGLIDRVVFASQGTFRDDIYLERPEIVRLKASDQEKLDLIRKAKAAVKEATLDNRCGRCGRDARINHQFRELVTYPGKGMDQHEEFLEWSMNALRDRVRLVQSFDRACDQIRDNFIGLLDSCRVVEETVMVPQTVKRIHCAGESV